MKRGVFNITLFITIVVLCFKYVTTRSSKTNTKEIEPEDLCPRCNNELGPPIRRFYEYGTGWETIRICDVCGIELTKDDTKMAMKYVYKNKS